ncbi:hypothetical protein D9M69_713360 [compost metagenome]
MPRLVAVGLPAHLAQHCLDHQHLQLLALRDVVVERHRAGFQPARERAHGQAGEAVCIDQRQRGLLELFTGEFGGTSHA